MKHGSNIPESEERLLADNYVTFRIYLSPSILCLVEMSWNISPHQTVEVLHLLFNYCSWEFNPPLFWMLSEDWSFLWTLCWNELYLPICILFFLVVTQLIQGRVTRCSWGMIMFIPYNAIVYSLLKTQSFCSAAAFPSSSQWDPLSFKVPARNMCAVGMSQNNVCPHLMRCQTRTRHCMALCGSDVVLFIENIPGNKGGFLAWFLN